MRNILASSTVKSIVIFSPGFPDGAQDTSCMPYLHMFMKALSANFPELKIHVIAFQYPFRAKTFQLYNCTIHSIGGANKKWNRLFTWRKAKQIFKTIHAAEPVSHILSLWLTECTYVAQHLSKKYSIPHIAWTIGQDVKKENKYISHLDFGSFKAVCMSPFLQDQLKRNHGIETNIILGNSIHPETIPLPELKEKSFDIISVGSFSSFKQFDWVVDCVHQLKERNPGIKACMVGDGEDTGRIKNKIAQLGLENIIELKGSIPHNECLELMMRSKILLHPSSFEGASTVILEALYFRCYVVSITVPDEKMPKSFFRINSLAEMISKTEELLSLPRNESSFCVSSSEETVKKLMKIFTDKP